MKYFCILFLPLFFNSNGVAQNIALNWAKQMAGGRSMGLCIYADASGFVYTTGRYQGTVDFDPGPGVATLTCNGGDWEAFVCKQDAMGNLVWVRQITGTAPNPPFTWTYGWGTSVITDNTGNVYSVGTFTTICDFDPGPGTFTLDPRMGSVFISKLNAGGNFVWAKQIADSSGAASVRMTRDVNANLIITGSFKGQGDFDPGPASYSLASVGIADIFICKLSSAGNFIWAKQMGSTGSDAVYYNTLDAAGNIYVDGTFSNTVDFDPGIPTYTLNSVSGQFFVTKFDANGNFVFAKQFGTPNATSAEEIRLDKWGNIYITGSFSGNTNFSTGPSIYTLSPVSSSDIYLSKLDPFGNFKWVRAMNGTFGYSSGNVIAMDTTGYLYLSGTFSSTVDFDPSPFVYNMTSLGNIDIYICKLDTAGGFTWAKDIGGPSLDQVVSIFSTAFQEVLITGHFRNGCDFDPGPGTYTFAAPGSDYNMYVAKYLRCSPPNSPTISPTASSGCGIASFSLSAVGAGTVNWSSSSSANNFIGSGSSFLTPILSPGSYSFYAKSGNFCDLSPYSAAATITVFPLPILSPVSNKSLICKGDTAILSASGALTYTWNNSFVIPTLKIFPITTSTYTVKGTDLNGCVNTATISQLVSNCGVGFEENTSNFSAILIYPNPTSGDCIIDTKGEENFRVRVSDLRGRILFQGSIKSGVEKVKMQEFTSGMYFFTFEKEGVVEVRKVVKE